eukprot:CAMPEP_0182906946 /NCGR_PEP_ID=MMETSP0034_2-20130328/34131_1 /TAXON_ID=156128 /ORGANISM="Nephroselmis pyriformis, Strain CCMP717" /LENGTH=230 /DNA_ID=CAMNT_0025042765 /DNA_START=113 /DNA_END=802 /DNA_ORIENTATION=+
MALWPALPSTAAALTVLALQLLAFHPVLLTSSLRKWEWQTFGDDAVNFLSEESEGWKGAGWPQAKWALTSRLAYVYEPVSWIVKGWLYAWLGSSPEVYVWASLALHASASLALLGLLREVAPLLDGLAGRRLDPRVGAAVAALAVGFQQVHPMRAEVVAWASCQAYALAEALGALSLWALAATRRRAAPMGWGAAVLFLLAGLSKSAAISVIWGHVLLEVLYLDSRLRKG